MSTLDPEPRPAHLARCRLTLGPNSLQENARRFVVAPFLPRQLRLGRDQPPLARRLQHRRPVPLQPGPRPLQRRNGVVQACELRLDLRYDGPLLVERWNRQLVVSTTAPEMAAKVEPVASTGQLIGS